jgi:hypothetical protein
MKFKPEDKETLRRERAAYNENQRQRSEIQELRSQIDVQNTDATTGNSPPDHISVSQRSQVSQMTSGQPSVIGGRNAQAQNRQNRRIAAVTTQRHVQSATLVNRQFDTPPPNTSANNECDTNADTCCLGKNFVVLHATFRTADVYAYDTSIKPIENVPIVSAATAYDDPMTGDTFILVFNEALYYGSKLDHSLINPNQVRAYGIPFWDNPYDPDKGLSIDVDDSLHIPLQPVGTKLQFRTRVPTAQELATCEHVHMTSPSIWNPSDIVMIQGTVIGRSILHRGKDSRSQFRPLHPLGIANIRMQRQTKHFWIRLTRPLSKLEQCWVVTIVVGFHKLTPYTNRQTCHPAGHSSARNAMLKRPLK